jgi:hypothetical protein
MLRGQEPNTFTAKAAAPTTTQYAAASVLPIYSWASHPAFSKSEPPSGRNHAISQLGNRDRPIHSAQTKRQNEKDHAWAWSLRFVGPMVTASSAGAS